MPDPHPALATIERFYDAETAYLAPGGGDFGVIAATLDPECVLYQPASLPYGGEWRDPAGFERWMKTFGQQWTSLEVRDAKFYPVHDIVFSHSHVYAVARATGQAVDWPLLQLFKVRYDKILELYLYHWDTAAMLPAMDRPLPGRRA